MTNSSRLVLKMSLSLCLLGVVSSAFAAPSIFEIPENDQSLVYLSYLFGRVGTVLPGGDNVILKLVITYFNNAVLVLGGLIVAYSSVISVVNTANDGEMLGKQWNSLWVPLRAAFGFALLLPVKAKGYTLIQVLLMWVVLQGVGAADYVWAEGVSAIQTGEATIAGDSPNAALHLAAQTMFVSNVCARQAGVLNRKGHNFRDTSKEYQYGVNGINPRDVCGSVTIDLKDLLSDKNNETFVGEILNAYVKLRDGLDEAAEEFVDAYNKGFLLDEDVEIAEDTTEEELEEKFHEAMGKITTMVNEAVNEYYTKMVIVEAAMREALKEESDTELLDHAKEQGWMMAGMYYFTLSKKGSSVVVTRLRVPKTTPYSDHMARLHAALGEERYEILQATIDTATDASVTDAIDYNSPSKVSDVFVRELGGIQKSFAKMVGFFTKAMTQGGDPLLEISSFGAILATVAILSWIVFTGVMVAMSATMGIMCSISSLCLVVETLTTMVVTPLLICIGALAIAGLVMEFYLPMIPFLVFSMSALGWMILVIEAMVAVPMLALGILHPEGNHPVWGRAESGIMIVAGVFLRPALMIVGLFAALGFSRVAITFVNVGFGPVAGSIIPNNASGALTFLAGFAMMMCIYVTFITGVFNRVFSLIYVLPDRIMRWIGGAAEQSSVESDMQAVGRGAEQGAKTTADISGGASANEAKGNAKQSIDKMRSSDLHDQRADAKAALAEAKQTAKLHSALDKIGKAAGKEKK